MNSTELIQEYEEADNRSIALAIKHLLTDPHGRKFAWWLLRESQAIASQPHTPGDPYQTAFNCGMTEVGNKILAAFTTTDGAAYMTFMLEMENDRTRRAETLDRVRADHAYD